MFNKLAINAMLIKYPHFRKRKFACRFFVVTSMIANKCQWNMNYGKVSKNKNRLKMNWELNIIGFLWTAVFWIGVILHTNLWIIC